MKLILAYAKTYIFELMRNTSAMLFTIFFPAVLSVCFSHSPTADSQDRLMTYIIYCNFAVQSVMLQALGISIAMSRANSWRDYLKTLPVSPIYSISGRILASLFFSLLSIGLVSIVNYFHHDVMLTLSQNGLIIFCALVGGIPMGLLAVFLGNLLNPVAARGGFVFLNTLLLFGVLASAPHGFIHEIIPSYQWLLFSLATISHKNMLLPFAWLVNYTLIFYLLIYTQKHSA